MSVTFSSQPRPLDPLMDVKLHVLTIRLHVRSVQKKHAVASGNPMKVPQQRRNVSGFTLLLEFVVFIVAMLCAAVSQNRAVSEATVPFIPKTVGRFQVQANDNNVRIFVAQ